MGTTYEYTYEYEVTDANKHGRSNATAGNYSQRTAGLHSNYGNALSLPVRPNVTDPLANLQHDRIWHKLYDPLGAEKALQEVEIQVSAGLFNYSQATSLVRSPIIS